MAPNRTPTNSRSALIKYELALRNLTLTELERRHGLYKGQCVTALRDPDEAGERVIAAALGQTPQEIWPERFDATGVRYKPQPRANYRTGDAAVSRRNAAAA